jgi:polyisoprenoid-binding protein YceI
MMKRLMLSSVLVLALVGVSRAADWTLDRPHSSVQFKVTHLVISNVVGDFGEFSCNLSFDGKDITTGSAEMTIDVKSINTENADRDKHLLSPDFFDVEKFPTMTFKSTKVTPGMGKEFKLTGNLTIKDVTKEVTFDCVFNGAIDFMGTAKSGFTAKTTIDRTEYGLSWSRAMETGGLVVSNEVEITLELEFNQSK